ncbi:MAG: hypothetical protein WAN20_09860 [Pseudonocardiaceae bacterium]
MMTIKWGLSPLEQLAEEFVTTTVPCPICEVPAGYRPRPMTSGV